MRLAFFGDVVGKAGRNAIIDRLPGIRRDLSLDFVIVNAENAAGGFGLTGKIAEEIFAAGADCITLGNHSWDQRDMLTYIEREERLIRPFNYPESLDIPGRGAQLFTLEDGRRVYVVQIHGRIFMDSLDDPFQGAQRAIQAAPLGMAADAVVLEIHAEATSEKSAMAHFLDGQASLVVGAHTHTPTADAQIYPGGTAFQSDAGMCGDYDSVIGMKKEIVLERTVTRLPAPRMEPADGEATVCGVYVETDDKTGLATRIDPIRVGGRLKQAFPEV
ncbi:MAG: metallophosphoesterase [Hirschia sp.]|nr:metallophosphoesterase [Hirschia sp.]MBF19099.1 metallophosphoesterase [Hirschia sp.]MBF20233.1 metallophosphoesterase [Hirschia sp.]|tara:strand:+ start:1723 stop:2544 length:822 start_codon:yes stop_codon:yes gene_type:complete